jgi:hypothetical protein
MQLIAHSQGPADQRLERDAAGGTDDVREDRRQFVAKEVKPAADVLVVRTVIQPVAGLTS